MGRRGKGLVLAAATACLLAPPAAPAAAAPDDDGPRITFRYRELGSVLRALEELATAPRSDLTEREARAVEDFADLRAAWEERYVPARPEPLLFGAEALVPPSAGQDPVEAFQLAFLEERSTDAVARRLRLSAREAARLAEAIEALAPRVRAGARALDRYAPLIRRLEKDAIAHDLPGFVRRVARFYGVERALPAEVAVDVLWSPGENDFLVATQVGRHVFLPLTPSWASGERELLSTVAHEIGHFLLTLLEPAARRELAGAIAAEGILNAQYRNVLEEALQTAVGTLLFAGDVLGRRPADDEPLYGAVDGETHPDAIDRLARAIEEPLRAHIDRRDGLAAFVQEALAAQRRLYALRPLHFTRACLVLAPRRDVARAFADLFPTAEPAETDARAFARSSARLDHANRWIVLTADDARREQGLAGRLGVGWAKRLLEDPDLAGGRVSALVQAARRGAGKGFDFVVVARDDAAARGALEHVFTADAMPTEAPLRIR